MTSPAAEFPNDNPSLHRGARWVPRATTGAPEPELPIAIVRVAAVVEPPALAVEEAREHEAPPVAIVFDPIPVLPERRPEPPPIVPPPRESAVVPAAFAVERDEEAAPTTLAELAAAVFEAQGADVEDEPVVVEELEPLSDEVAVEGPFAEVLAAEPAAPLAVDPFQIFVRVLVDVALVEGTPAAAACVQALFEGRASEEIADDVLAALAASDIATASGPTPGFVARSAAWREILRGTSDDFGACGSAMLDDWAADVLARVLGAPARQPALKRDLRARGIAAFGLVDVAA